jgi:hypothetical protein
MDCLEKVMEKDMGGIYIKKKFILNCTTVTAKVIIRCNERRKAFFSTELKQLKHALPMGNNVNVI